MRKTKKKEEIDTPLKTGEITIPYKEARGLYLRQVFVSGKYASEKYGTIPCAIDMVIGGSGSLYIQIGKIKFLISTNDILRAMFKSLEIDEKDSPLKDIKEVLLNECKRTVKEFIEEVQDLGLSEKARLTELEQMLVKKFDEMKEE